jgi:N-methylhydantoinase A
VTAALWSAVGAATADVVHVLQSPQTFEEPFDVEKLLAEFRHLEARALGQLRSEGFESDSISLSRWIRMRYAMQVHDVEVPVDAAWLGEADANGLIHRFGVIYENLFGTGSGYREGGVEITGFRVRARGETEKVEFVARDDMPLLATAQTEREIFWGETGKLTPTPVWEIGHGQRIPTLAGPALVQLPDSVVVIRPGQRAEMDEFGNIIIHVL